MNITESLYGLEKEIREETVRTVMRELNHLIGSGLLVVNQSQGTFVHSPVTDNVCYYPEIKIEVKDKEHISKLELENSRLIGENKHLRDMIKSMSEVAAQRRWE